MQRRGFTSSPGHRQYDVVIVGGAIMGSSLAWWLTELPGFEGRVLVVERDPGYADCSTAHTNSCIRLQFSTELNIRISQFTAGFIRNLRAHLGGDPRIPDLEIDNFGYLYLADDAEHAATLRAQQSLQRRLGAGTRLLTPDQLRQEFPFLVLDDIVLGSHNCQDEGYWDGGLLFEWFRRSAQARGVEYLADTVVGVDCQGDRVRSLRLAGAGSIACGQVVNATGPRAARFARLAGLDLPVEPRKRYSWVFSAEQPLDRTLPLTIDPSGLHVRQDGPGRYLVGSRGRSDPAVEPDDFAMEPGLWEEQVWPTLAARIPAFEAIRVHTAWTGHYAYNCLDQNAILGPHPDLGNFLFMNGFSGHGLQQAAAMGRGLAEWIIHGAYQSLDLSPLHYERVARGEALVEGAVI